MTNQEIVKGRTLIVPFEEKHIATMGDGTQALFVQVLIYGNPDVIGPKDISYIGLDAQIPRKPKQTTKPKSKAKGKAK